jgi:glycosyltransferase involved in cell wall biosynthesis
MDVTVVVATFGDEHWERLAAERAVPSAEALGVPVLHVHAATLHEARNAGVEQVATEWVCHLDADDELEPGYFEAMSRATADLRAPAVRYVRGQQQISRPRVPDQVPLEDGNWLVVGTLVRAELVLRVGGWRDWPMYEDWDLWQRCHLAGATVEAVPAAVYRAHVRHNSRNRAPRRAEKLATHQAIRRANGLEAA